MTPKLVEHPTPRLRLTGSKHSLRHNNRVIRSCASSLRCIGWVGVNLSRAGTERPPLAVNSRRRNRRTVRTFLGPTGETNRWFNYRECRPFTQEGPVAGKPAVRRRRAKELEAFLAMNRRKRAAILKRLYHGKSLLRLAPRPEPLPSFIPFPPEVPFPFHALRPHHVKQVRKNSVAAIALLGRETALRFQGMLASGQKPNAKLLSTEERARADCRSCIGGYCSAHWKVPDSYREAGMEPGGDFGQPRRGTRP